MTSWFLFFLLTFFLALIFKVPFFYHTAYIFGGLYLFLKIGKKLIQQGMACERIPSEERIFLGEEIKVELRISNHTFFPVPWLRVDEKYPFQLAKPGFFPRIIPLSPRGRTTITYKLSGRYRGYYPLGPLDLSSGDIFGLASWEKREEHLTYLTVYPRIVPLSGLGIPSKQPFGLVHSQVSIFEDPTRISGMRDYFPSDSYNRIHWKATAHTGKLQVKLHEPTISMGTVIFLNLNLKEYDMRYAVSYSELAIVVASSIAHYIYQLKQKVGLVTYGHDPLTGEEPGVISILPNKGYLHLMRILGVLARIKVVEERPFGSILAGEAPHLPWGTTIIIISPRSNEELLLRLLRFRRQGYNVVLIIVRDRAHQMLRQCSEWRIKAYHVKQQEDIDVWRKSKLEV